MRLCPKCNKPISDDSLFCESCGTRIPSPEPPAPTASKRFFSSAGSLDGSLSTAEPEAKPVVTPVRTPTPPPAAAPGPGPMPKTSPRPAPKMPPKITDIPPAAAVSSAPVRKKPSRRISVGKELKLLLRQGILVLLGEKRNLIISLLFPFIAAIITVWIAGEEMFVTYEATKSACFILVCAAIWCGLFNSIQSLVKERENIKRDYVSGALRIECYMGSRAIIQFVLCFAQSFVLSLSIPAMALVYSNYMPDYGLLGGPSMPEFFLSLFMIMYASDALGLLISSIVKKEELASKLAPYILIAQLLFSGVLFKLEGAASALSGIMISRWGMEALGSICDLNNQSTKIYTEMDLDTAECACVKMANMKTCPCTEAIMDTLHLPEYEEMFEATGGHFLWVLFVMFLFIAVPLVAGDLMLHRVKNDSRD